jgi:LAO/AO transport system kinase
MIMIETVGAGQAEVDIARLAHTTLVVEAPGLGDDIQAIKAGILEIADILVVNKADRPGVENTERALRSMLQLAHPQQHQAVERSAIQHHGGLETLTQSSQVATEAQIWEPPILRTVATEGDGIAELATAITQHRTYLHNTGDWQRRERSRLNSELEALLRERLVSRWRETISASRYQQVLDHLVARQISPLQAMNALIDGGQPT